MTTPVPFGAGECALDRPERTDWGYHLDHLEEGRLGVRGHYMPNASYYPRTKNMSTSLLKLRPGFGAPPCQPACRISPYEYCNDV